MMAKFRKLMQSILNHAILILLSISSTQGQSAPTYCSYADGIFECDYAQMTDPAHRPIDFASFNPTPQRLVLKVNGPLPYIGDTQVFSEGFASISSSNFDTNYPASLTLDCGRDGSLFITAGAFANMCYIQHLKIKNCLTYYLPAEAFKELVSLDYFTFEGGQLNDVNANAMAYMSVEKLTSGSHSFPQNVGHFEMRNTKLNTSDVPPGLLFGWKNLTSVTFKNAQLSTIAADTFRYTTRLRYIDLSNNLFTSLPSDVFDGLDGLSEIHLYNIDWECTCSNLEWFDSAKTKNITLFGDLSCASPPGMRVESYWYKNCVDSDICGDQIGIAWTDKKHCFNMFALASYGLAFVAFGLIIISLILMIHNKRQVQEQSQRKGKAKREWENKRKNSRFKAGAASLPFTYM